MHALLGEDGDHGELARIFSLILALKRSDGTCKCRGSLVHYPS